MPKKKIKEEVVKNGLVGELEGIIIGEPVSCIHQNQLQENGVVTCNDCGSKLN